MVRKLPQIVTLRQTFSSVVGDRCEEEDKMRMTSHRRAISLLSVALMFLGCTRSPEVRSARSIEAGKKLLQRKDAARATLEFRNAVQATPKNAEAHYQLSLALMAAGDLRNGFVSLHKALDLDPKHTGAQLRYAQLLAETRDPELLK